MPYGKPEDVGGRALVAGIVGRPGGERVHPERELGHVEAPVASVVGLGRAYLGGPIVERNNRIGDGCASERWSSIVGRRFSLRAIVILVSGNHGLGRRLGIDYGNESFRDSAYVARCIGGRRGHPVVAVFQLGGHETPCAKFISGGGTEPGAVAVDLDAAPGFRPARQCQSCVVGGPVLEQPGVFIEPDYDRSAGSGGIDSQDIRLGSIADASLIVGSGRGEAVQTIGQRAAESKAPRSVHTGVRFTQNPGDPVYTDFQVGSGRAYQGRHIIAGNSIALNSGVVLVARDDWYIRNRRLGMGLGPETSCQEDGAASDEERERYGQPQDKWRLNREVHHRPMP